MAEWHFMEWSGCSKTCGGGQKTRAAVCKDGRGQLFGSEECGAGGEDVTMACNEEQCPCKR